MSCCADVSRSASATPCCVGSRRAWLHTSCCARDLEQSSVAVFRVLPCGVQYCCLWDCCLFMSHHCSQSRGWGGTQPVFCLQRYRARRGSLCCHHLVGRCQPRRSVQIRGVCWVDSLPCLLLAGRVQGCAQWVQQAVSGRESTVDSPCVNRVPQVAVTCNHKHC